MSNDEKQIYKALMPVWLNFIMAKGQIMGRARFKAWLERTPFQIDGEHIRLSPALVQKMEANIWQSWIIHNAQGKNHA